ncbi:hypothetical protein FH972_023500 [Carpinus fangiana]|uniref:Uncharacterized protein n=1 Tax=Carpinus fangiana TaxID=176857 RepID=A0A5N6KVZ1_9ROSI|nr:hypothetical protein FH972_023500 [Carpinus fangiana]
MFTSVCMRYSPKLSRPRYRSGGEDKNTVSEESSPATKTAPKAPIAPQKRRGSVYVGGVRAMSHEYNGEASASITGSAPT